MPSLPVRLSTFSLALGLMALVGAAGGVALHRLRPRSPIARGVVVDDRRVPDDDHALAAWLDARREAAAHRTVRFRFEDRTFEASFEDVGIALDMEATLAGASRIGHEGSWWAQIEEGRRAEHGEIEVPAVWRVDEARARAHLATYASVVARAPVDARIDLDKHTRYSDDPGRALDVDATFAALQAGDHEDREQIPLLTRRVAAKVTLDQLTRVNIEKVLSAYETTFSLYGTGAGRAVNIKNAVSFIDGLVLAPGQAFSFNDVVGPRKREHGFVLAPEIQGDEMQMGYGGGTCQASTTVFDAALFGNLDIEERHSHSRPSHYAPMGLDATVNYPLTDLKLRNPYSFPILFHAWLPRPTAVRVEILGGAPNAKVEHWATVEETEDFDRRVDEKTSLRPGSRVLHQKGIQGFEVMSWVKVKYDDGREEVRHHHSSYRPVPEIYWVAPGYDMAALPPLPEHAKGAQPAASEQAPVGDSSVGG